MICRLDRNDQDRPSGLEFAFRAEGDLSSTADSQEKELDAEYAARCYTEQLSRGCTVFREAADPPLDRMAEASAGHA